MTTADDGQLGPFTLATIQAGLEGRPTDRASLIEHDPTLIEHLPDRSVLLDRDSYAWQKVGSASGGWWYIGGNSRLFPTKDVLTFQPLTLIHEPGDDR